MTFLYNDVGFRKNEPFHGSRQSSYGRGEPFFLGGLRPLLAAFFEIWGAAAAAVIVVVFVGLGGYYVHVIL